MASTSMVTVANALTAQRITPWPRETKDLGKLDIDLAEPSSFNPEIQKRIICTDWAWAQAKSRDLSGVLERGARGHVRARAQMRLWSNPVPRFGFETPCTEAGLNTKGCRL